MSPPEERRRRAAHRRLLESHLLGGGAARPWHVTVIGGFALVGAAAGLACWAFCAFAARPGAPLSRGRTP